MIVHDAYKLSCEWGKVSSTIENVLFESHSCSRSSKRLQRAINSFDKTCSCGKKKKRKNLLTRYITLGKVEQLLSPLPEQAPGCE